MSDLPDREWMAVTRARVLAETKNGDDPVELTRHAVLTLLDMAGRAVSGDTLDALSAMLADRTAWHESATKEEALQLGERLDSTTCAFRILAERDLRESAQALARGKGGDDG